jgi:hypothetical protein
VKWLIFVFGLACAIPLTGWLKTHPRELPKVLMLTCALPLVMGALPKHEIVLFGNPDWPGYSKGFSVSIMDLAILAMYFNLSRTRTPLPFKLTFAFYIGAVLLSALHAPNPTAVTFYAWQLLRIFMTYVVVARACADIDMAIAALKGMALGLCFQGLVVFWQRFGLHLLHVTGTFAHQNVLGFIIHFIIYPFFALLLSGQREWQLAAVPVIGMIIDIITTSRAAIGLAGGGFSILFFLSVLRKWTARKASILVTSAAVLILLWPLAYRQFELRFGKTSVLPEYGAEGRGALNDSAQLILSENPMGIGANNYFVAAATRGYFERAKVPILSQNLIPHNAYWTTAAETGYIGIAALLIFLLRPMQLAFFCGWRNRNDRRGDLLLGLFTSFLIVFIHSWFEWNLFLAEVQYVLAIDLGLIAAMAGQLNYWPLKRRRRNNRA